MRNIQFAIRLWQPLHTCVFLIPTTSVLVRFMCNNKTSPVRKFESKILTFIRNNPKYETSIAPKLITESSLENADIFQQVWNESSRMCLDVNYKGIETKLNCEVDSIDNAVNQLTQFILLQRPEQRDFHKQLQKLDSECCNYIQLMTVEQMFRTLDTWLCVLNHGVTELRFYSFTIRKVQHLITNEQVAMHIIFQFMFFVALLKKSKSAKDNINRSLLHLEAVIRDLQNAAIEEICILSSATYKTGTKITSQKLLNILSETLIKNVHLFVKEPELLISVVKSLRHSQHITPDLLKSLSISLESADLVRTYDLATKVHLLLFFTNGQYTDTRTIVETLIKHCIHDFSSQKQNLPNYIRPKDIAMFLWSVSNFGLELQPKVIDQIFVPYINRQRKDGLYNNNFDMLISSLLSLCMIAGFHAENLFKQFISEGEVRKLKEKNKVRPLSRLALILTMMAVEAPHIMTEHHKRWKSYLDVSLPKPNANHQLRERAALRKVYKGLENISSMFSQVKCEFNIPHIHVAAITMNVLINQERLPVCIEVLDDTVCFHGTDKPNGLMKLKLRLLDGMSVKFVTVSHLELKTVNSNSIDVCKFLEDKVQNVVNK